MYNQIHRIIYSGAILLLFSASIFVGCQSKQDKTNDETTTTEMNSDKPKSEWQVYKESAETSITNNEQRIQALKDKIKQSNTPNLDKLRQKRIDDLEAQNSRLRSKIMDYKEEEASSNWEQFKTDVQKELDDIEKSLKDLDNNK